MIKLRDYQQAVVDKILAAWVTVLNVLAVVPTGGGKTVIFSWIISEHRGCSAAIVHRKEILGQISLSLAALGVKHRVIAPPKTIAMIRKKHMRKFKKSLIDPNAKCGVVSVQTLTSPASVRNEMLQRWVRQVTLAVYDEGHHYVDSGSWAKAVNLFATAKKLFVSATPERGDGKGLGEGEGGFCHTMVEGPTTAWLIDRGFLSRFKYKAPDTDLDMSDLPVTASGEVNAKVLRARTVESHLVGDVAERYTTDPDVAGKKTIVFASDCATADELAAAFVARGVKAVALSGATDDGVRERELDNFENGDTDVLVNVDLFDEGFDVPKVEVVILARVTMSLGKYLQMVGRALRILEGKEFAVVVDHVRNWERHGMPNWPRAWGLEAREKGGRSGPSDTERQRVCRGCSQPYEMYHAACPVCGQPHPVPAGRATPEQVGGDLKELDVEGMALQFEKYRKENLTHDEFALDMIARNIPVIGRGRVQKAHDTKLYRRKVLHELVAWWVGMSPPGREMSETHRRFFYRFGVDIQTAFTLDAAQTDKLIDKIQKKFTEDLQP